MNQHHSLIDRRDVIAMFPPSMRMTLRKFKRTTAFVMLEEHAVRLNRKNVCYPRSKVVSVLKITV
jgi:hypothetical protein